MKNKLDKIREAAGKYSINMAGINVSKTFARQEAFIAGATSPEAGEYWNGWVSVGDDEKPEDNQIVLVLFINSHKEVCQCAAWFQKITRHIGEDSPKDERWFVYPSSGHEIRPTHWRPLLPSPPKTDNQNDTQW